MLRDHAPGRRRQGVDHLGVLDHAAREVGAPDGDLARLVSATPQRFREAAGHALEVREEPVSLLVLEGLHRVFEKGVVVHDQIRSLPIATTLYRREPAVISHFAAYRPCRPCRSADAGLWFPRGARSLIPIKLRPRASRYRMIAPHRRIAIFNKRLFPYTIAKGSGPRSTPQRDLHFSAR